MSLLQIVQDAADDQLGGFVPGSGLNQFTRFGSKGLSIAGEHNPVLGSPLYGLFPEGWGNSLAGIHTGGLGNVLGGTTLFNTGRGDNPGMTLISLRLAGTLSPMISFETVLNNFLYNQDFLVNSSMDGGVGNGPAATVEAGYVGTEWANQIKWLLSPNFFILTEAQVFLPGGVVSDVVETLTGADASAPALRLVRVLRGGNGAR